MTPARRGVIFDLDGTLVDSLDDIAAALNHALVAHRFDPVSTAQVRRWVGDGATTLCRRAAPHAGEELIAALRADFADAYRRGCLDRTHFFPGVRATLAALHAARVPMAVLSNKPDEFTRLIVAALFEPGWFRAVCGVRDEAERKPSPGAALEIARGMDVPAERVWLVGDSCADIATARAAGMIAVAVTWGFRDAEELRAASPDYVVDRMEQVLDLLQVGHDGASTPRE